jgi:hypothetical protein
MIHPVDIALTYEGVREVGGPNRGPEVDRFLRTVGRKPGHPWCAAFVSTCVLEAYQQNYNLAGNVGPIDERSLPIPLTAGVMNMWSLTPIARRTIPKPGVVFIIDNGINPKTGARIGHCGFVTALDGTRVKTIEANTNVGGSREGDGVYQRTRWVADLHGFIDVSPKGGTNA